MEMLQTTWIALLLGFWSSLYLLDVFLKTRRRSARAYIELLESTGLSISICQLRWYTTWLNRIFVRFAQWRPHFLRSWFTVGVFFGLIAMLLSMFLLSLLVVNTITRQPIEQQVLTPVMPGVNLPTSQITYYLLTLLICGILHEFGHAIAAIREQVRVNGFGVFLFLIYPGAFVDLSTEHIQIISPLRQLRIYCAGVWHNFITVIIAIIVLYLLPFVLIPFYSQGNSVVITNVLQNSAVSGPRGLTVGEELTYISDCRVTNTDDWFTCIDVSVKQEPNGYCMSIALIKELNTAHQNWSALSAAESSSSYVDCCNLTSHTHLCFYYHTKASPNIDYACLPARSTTDRLTCHLHSDCYMPKVEMTCVYPVLENTTKLLRVHHGHKPPLLFLGHPVDLHYSVMVSNYVPKSHIIPLNLPYVIETFCKYLISLSGALVILNVVPCYALDGQLICQGFIELMLRSALPSRQARAAIYTIFVLFGTVLLFLNVVIAMVTLFS